MNSTAESAVPSSGWIHGTAAPAVLLHGSVQLIQLTNLLLRKDYNDSKSLKIIFSLGVWAPMINNDIFLRYFGDDDQSCYIS